jgi:CHAT domain-containing protein
MRSLLMNPQIPLNLGPLEVKTLRPKDEGRSHLYEMFISPFLTASQGLYHLLINPVEGELSRFKVLGIIPNGKLHLLPFQALGEKDQKGAFRFLVEDKSLFYLNSQSILKFAQKRAKKIGDTGNLIAFGNPDNSLKYAEEEIELIKGIYSKAKTYVRGDATEAKVKTGLAGFNMLHLATHGKMKGNIKESFILLAPTSDGKEDGKLFLREIWGLQLMGYQLVTLSACETARGKEASGDIMVSLETAFLRAGTPTILASLWEVDDQATGTLMKTFYDNVMGQGKADALRGAQVALLKDPRYVYPYYWAPFVLVGDWR